MKVNKETRIFSLKKIIFSTIKLNSRSLQLFSSSLSPSRPRTARLLALAYFLTSVLVLNFRFQIFREKNLGFFSNFNFLSLNFVNFWIKGWQGENRKTQFLYICSFTLFAGLQEWTWGDLQQSGESFHLCKSGLFCFHSDSSIVSIWVWLFIF